MWHCQACSFTSYAQNSLKCHVTKRHYREASSKGLRMCTLCGKMEASIEALHEYREVEHDVRMVKKHKCPLCYKVFTSYCLYRTHTDGHKHNYKCVECDRAFMTQACLNCHMLRAHKVLSVLKHKKLICEICGHQEDQKNCLEEHQITAHSIDFGERFACTVCDEVCQTRKQLNKHTRWHHSSSPNLTCEICSKVFKHMST